jgi:hypothetical protein
MKSFSLGTEIQKIKIFPDEAFAPTSSLGKPFKKGRIIF